MFYDIVAEIRDRTPIVELHSDSQYWLNQERSEHKHLFIFQTSERYRFLQMLVKADEEAIRNRGNHYKAVCIKLNIDVKTPLVITYGVFRPRTMLRFQSELNLRRNWGNNTILLNLPDDIKLADPNSYDWDRSVLVRSPDGLDPWYCEDATVRVRKLMEIRNQTHVAGLVEELLQASE
jgi:hypothetical protein